MEDRKTYLPVPLEQEVSSQWMLLLNGQSPPEKGKGPAP